MNWTDTFDGVPDERYFAALHDEDPERQPPETLPAIERCIATFREWLYMPDPGALLVTLATVVANRADGDPVWLLVVGPPGGGKTEIVISLKGQPDVRQAATITEASLLSGTPKKERAAGSKGGLLREIGAFGIIVLKDFGSILSMNREARSAVLAALREIYDGEWTRYVGTEGGQTLSWSGKVALIAGVTPAIDAHHAVIGSMGERFLLYRLPAIEPDEQARRALGHVGRESSMRRTLAAAVGQALAGADRELLLAEPAEQEIRRLIDVSTLAVRCRSAVDRDGYTREITLIPEPEAPARMALVLLRLLNGLRAIGVDAGQAWALTTKCALDSMPAIRRTVLERLVAQPEPITTVDLAEDLGYPTNTARRALEDLAVHGVLVRTPQGQGRADLWRASEWTRGRWPGTVPEMLGGLRSGNGGDPLSYKPSTVQTDISGTPPDLKLAIEWEAPA